MKRAEEVAGGDSWIVLILRVLVGAVFIFAGFQKCVAPVEEFSAVVETYAILPPDWTLPFAEILRWAELFFGVFLVAGYSVRSSAKTAAGLLALFIMALGSAVLRKLDIDNCGCFGSSVHLNPKIGIFFDAALLGCSLWVSKHAPGRASLDSWISRGRA